MIDPRVGALHEVNGQLFLGPPKTAESAESAASGAFVSETRRGSPAPSGAFFDSSRKACNQRSRRLVTQYPPSFACSTV